MPIFSFDINTDNQQWSRMAYQTIKGEGRVQPKLQIVFLSRSLPKDTEIRIIQSKINLFIRDQLQSKEELIGKGEMVENGPILYDNFDTSLRYDVLINRLVLDYAQQHFVNYNLPLDVEISMLLNVKFRSQAAAQVVAPTGQEWENRLWLISTKPTRVTIEIPQGDWINNVLNPLAIQEHILIEMTIPPISEREKWKNALTHLETAQERLIGGDDTGVLAACFAAFEAVARGGDYGHIFDKIADEEKRKQVDKLFFAAKNYLNSGRHTIRSGPQQGEFAADHRDAMFALGLARLCISYTAQLLVETPAL
jgi:hypothetical protein